MFSSAPPRPPRPPHNVVVSAITFEGFKLRSSNMTHALLIQISRTSLIIDIVVHPAAILSKLNKKVPYRSEMAKNSIENEFQTSKMVDRSEMGRNAIESDFRISKMATEKKKFRIDLRWPEMRSKVNFGHPK